MGSYPLPALDVRPPEDPLAQYTKLVQLRSAMQQQQYQHGQIQLQQQQLETNARKMQEGQAFRQTYSSVSQRMPNATQSDLIDATVKELSSNPAVSPETIQSLQLHSQDLRAKAATADDAVLKLHATQVDNLRGAFQPIYDLPANTPPDQLEQLYQQRRAAVLANPQAYGVTDPASIPPQFPGKDAGQFLMTSLTGISKQLQEEQQRREIAAKESEAASKATEAATGKARLAAELPKLTAESAVAPQMAQLGVQKSRADISKTYAETAQAQASTAKTKVETQNLGEQPIFAVDPRTQQRVMTTRPEAQANGYTNPVAVKEGDVAKERDATAMTNDVQLNKSRYLSAMRQVYHEPMSGKQMTALTALTPEKLGIDLGFANFSLPDVMQRVSNASAFSVLSPAQKQAVIGFYSTLASVPAAQKALTGIGRSNKEMLDLELRTIPTPIMDAGTFDAMLDRFQGNITQTAAKNVRIPGMPTTLDIRNLYEGPQAGPQGPQVNFKIPRPMTNLSSLLGNQ